MKIPVSKLASFLRVGVAAAMLLSGTQAWSLAPQSELQNSSRYYFNRRGEVEINLILSRAFNQWGNYQVVDAGKPREKPESLGPFGFGSLINDTAKQKKFRDLVARAKKILLKDSTFPFKAELERMRVVAVEGMPYDVRYDATEDGEIRSVTIPWDILAGIVDRDANTDPKHPEYAEAIYELVDMLMGPTRRAGRFGTASPQLIKILADARERTLQEMELRERVLKLETFAERLKAVREARGLSQTDLARMADVFSTEVNRWERANKEKNRGAGARAAKRRGPHAKNVLGLCKALRFPADILFFGKYLGEKIREQGCTPYERLRDMAYVRGISDAQCGLMQHLAEDKMREIVAFLKEDERLVFKGTPTRLIPAKFIPDKEFASRMAEIALLPWRERLSKVMELLLEQRGMSLKEFCAGRNDVVEETLLSYMSRRRNPQPRNIPGLAAAFDIESDELLFAQSLRKELSVDSNRGSRLEKAGCAAGLGQEALAKLCGFKSHVSINHLISGKQKDLDDKRWLHLVIGLRNEGLDVDAPLLRYGEDIRAPMNRDYSLTRSGEEVPMSYREHEQEGGIDPFIDMSFRIRSGLRKNGYGDNIWFVTRNRPMGKKFLSFSAWLGKRTGHKEFLKHMKKLLKPDGESPSCIKVIRGFTGSRVAGIPPNPLPCYRNETIVGHAGDRGIYAFVDKNYPEDRENVQTNLIHEFGARMGMKHAFNALLEDLYAEWSKKERDRGKIKKLLKQVRKQLASYPERIKMRNIMPKEGFRERDLSAVRAAGATVGAEWEELYDKKAQAAANLARALMEYSSPAEDIKLPKAMRFKRTDYQKATALDRAAYALWSYWDDRRLLVQPRADEPWSFEVLKVGNDRVYRLGTLVPADPNEKATFVGILMPEHPEEKAVLVGYNFVKEINPQATVKDVPALIEALHGLRDPERYVAIRALGMMGANAKSAAVPLMNLLRARPWALKYRAFDSLVKIGPYIIDNLADAFLYGWNFNALEVLKAMGPKAKKAIPLLSPALSDPRKGFKISVALTLVAIDPTIPGLAEALADALERKDQSDVLEAYLLIGNPARETLLGELRSSNTKRQLGAAIALAHIDPSVKEGIPILAENLEDRFVSEAISKMGAAAVPSLVQALNNRSRRNGAVNALGLIGSQARQAMPWLLGYVVHGFFQKGDGDVQFRDHVVEAILRIDRLSLGVLWNYPQLQTLAEQALAHMHVLDERAFATRNRVDNDAGTTNPITASP